MTSEEHETAIDFYNALVTSAIGRAERMEREPAHRVREAWAEVARWEQKLAELLPADDEEGRAARRGSIWALLEAGRRDDADRLLRAFRDEPAIQADDVKTMQAALDEGDARVAKRFPAAARHIPISELLRYTNTKDRGGGVFPSHPE